MDIVFTNIPAADGNSDALPWGQIERATLQVGGFGTFTATVQHSVDGSTWVNVAAGLSAAGVVDVNLPTNFVRINISGHSAGTPTVDAVGWVRRQ